MYQKSLYDITEVCKIFGTTSRTLRFYEEKGIIESTTLGLSSRRQYTEEQLSNIKNVLILRTLGVSVNSILKLQENKLNLRDIILSKRAEIYASIETRMREIHLLNEALTILDSGKTIFNDDWHHLTEPNADECEIARACTTAIASGDHDFLYRHLSTRLAQYMPENVYSVVRKDMLALLGNYVSIDAILADDNFPNRIYAFVLYENLGLKITFVFHNREIDGLWLGYYETKK